MKDTRDCRGKSKHQGEEQGKEDRTVRSARSSSVQGLPITRNT